MARFKKHLCSLLILLLCMLATPSQAGIFDKLFPPRNGKAVVKKTQKQNTFKGWKIKHFKKGNPANHKPYRKEGNNG